MENKDRIQLYEDQPIRTAWDEEREEWYFSIVDVVGILTEQPSRRGASNYWAKMKQRLKEEGAEQLLTNCQQLKMKSPKDGKRYPTDVASTEQLLRIIQSIHLLHYLHGLHCHFHPRWNKPTLYGVSYRT